LTYRRNKRTRAFAESERVREFSRFERQAWKRLEILDAATSLGDLRNLPSNRFEGLHGDREGQFSIRINGQWRMFRMGARRRRTVECRDR